MKLRRLAAVVALIAAVAGLLTSCRTNVGTAASVDGHRISENTVGDYVLESGPSAAADGTSGQPVPRATVLQYLVLQQAYRRTLSSLGQNLTPGELSRNRNAAIQLLLQSQVTGAQFDAQLRQLLARAGVKASFASVFVQVQELEYVLVRTQNLRSPTDVAAAVRKAGVTVRVNPRYGSWSDGAKDGQLGIDVNGGKPSFLTLQNTALTGS